MDAPVKNLGAEKNIASVLTTGLSVLINVGAIIAKICLQNRSKKMKKKNKEKKLSKIKKESWLIFKKEDRLKFNREERKCYKNSKNKIIRYQTKTMNHNDLI